MKKFIVATKNQGKLKEIQEILAKFPFQVVSMVDEGITKDIDESGTTFEDNALIKAREVHKITGEIVMADDSGLEVDYLDGAPGVYSARFAGENASDEDKNNKLLELLKDVPYEERKARFVCAIAVVLSNGEEFTVKGVCEGYIGFKPEGKNGFGYDPLFYVPEFNMTTAQMKPEQKHEISHRGKALRLMAEKLKKRV
ncbi:MAG TPA: XTP/dITP diphosphatase [Clostridium sp.]|jgi:XTP/dITP diphosphohydrolase|nr:XTP/dITP diphosphatase [Clostridium sp.]